MLMKVHRWDGAGDLERDHPDVEEAPINLDYIVATFPAQSVDDAGIHSRIHLSDIAEPYHTMQALEGIDDFLAFEGR